MLRIEKIEKGAPDYYEFVRLYHEAFPKNEQVPLVDLLSHPEDTEMEAYYDDDIFCGFYSAIFQKDILCILYFSIEGKMRNLGLGSKILQNIKDNHLGYRIIADVEMPKEDAINEKQRLSRKHFYYSNGFKDTDIVYKWKNTDYQIMIWGGTITKEEYNDFFHHLDKKRQHDM